ncbi:MAG: Glutamine synthetase 2 [Verrucomicrobiota bacterium]
MPKYKLEYIWLDGYTPLANLRSKTQIKEFSAFPKLAELPAWGFDGSSTRQAEGKSSDIVLKPVAVFPDSTRKNGVLVMCETYLHTGVAHPSNSRATIPDDPDTWFGFEQEYFFYKDGAPLGFPAGGFPEPQGPYYTGVGYKNVGSVAREIVEHHIDICLDAGINLEGINAEVAKGQWEFQIFGKGSKSAADQMWVARYIMSRLCEKYGIDVARLERFRHALELLHEAHARGGRKGLLRETHGRLCETHGRAYRGLRTGEPPPSHRPARDAVDRQVQLRRRRPRRVDPRPAQLRQQRLQGLP